MLMSLPRQQLMGQTQQKCLMRAKVKALFVHWRDNNHANHNSSHIEAISYAIEGVHFCDKMATC